MSEAVPYLFTLRWQDAVDILLNGYILFRLYILIRGTIVFRVALGIGLLWLLQRLAVALNLVVTSWVAQGVAAVAALVIIVVFRSEIRSVLQATTVRDLLWGVPRKAPATPVELVSEAVIELARRRVGALLVFPGRMDLSEQIHSGIPWEGVISKEMIGAVFSRMSPVHDGAAIVEGARVSQVSCILPLSRREDLPPGVGTRHRAAAGLAETSDALVVVVSEERGRVSVAKGNRLWVVEDSESLARELRRHLGVTEKRGSVRRQNLELALAGAASLAFVWGLWFTVARGQESLARFEIPVEYASRDPALEVTGSSTATLNLHLRGSSAILRSLKPDQLKVRIDLENRGPGANTIAVTKDDIQVPPGVEVTRVEPSLVEVMLDRRVSKILPVQADWSGRLSPQLIMTDVRVDPARVKVLGGSQVLKEVETLYTEKIPLERIQKSGQVSARIVLHPPSLKLAPDVPDRVTVTYAVKRRGSAQ